MEDIAFNDWPGQPVDLGSTSTIGSAGGTTTNSWYPAYGFQPPPGLLEREDFLGNPDADYFFQGNPPPYLYLETIHEETSDDLRSDSDLSEASGGARGGIRGGGGGFRDGLRSPLGWLASDSETDSVICMDVTNDDSDDSESDREIACPIKRRRQDNNNILLSLPCEDDYQSSLSRSSSLLQFETLEKQCQETSSSSPSLYSQYSIDSLEFPQIRISATSTGAAVVVNNQQPPSLTAERNKTTRNTESESSDCSGDSDGTLKSCTNLIKAWHSLDSLPFRTSSDVAVENVGADSTGSSGSCDKSKEKISVENLSEDSGYSDHIKTSSRSDSSMIAAPTVAGGQAGTTTGSSTKKKLLLGKTESSPNFGAYDCEVFQQFTGNFGASCQNLSVFDDHTRWISLSSTSSTSSKNASLILDKLHHHHQHQQQHQQQQSSECGRACSKFNSLSEPNLLIAQEDDVSLISDENDGVATTSSVPKDLDRLLVNNNNNNRQQNRDECWSGVLVETSIAAKNWDLGDFSRSFVLRSQENTSTTAATATAMSSDNKGGSSSYRREGSYAEAMRNRVDLSDDEQSLCHVKKKPLPPTPKTTLEIFDRKILNVITESLQSINSGALPDAFVNTNTTNNSNTGSTLYGHQANKRNVVSTPNLATNQSDVDSEIIDILMEDDRRRSVQDIPHRQSTSTSCISDADLEERTLLKSIYGESSASSTKGVHFSPVVSEVNWRDTTNGDSRSSSATATPEREEESSYSLSNSSSPDRDDVQALTKLLLGKGPSPEVEFTSSQPQLLSSHVVVDYDDDVDNVRDRIKFKSQSQPDISKMRRRGSQLIKRDKDGCIIKAYIDKDGIEYKHTNIGIGVSGSGPVRGRQIGPADGISAAATVAVAAVVNRGPPLITTAAVNTTAAAAADTTIINKSHVRSGLGGALAAPDGSGSWKDININNKHRGTARAYASASGIIMDPVNVSESAARGNIARGASSSANNQRIIVVENNNKSKSGGAGNKLGGFFSRLASFRFSNRKSSATSGADGGGGGGGRAKKKADGAKKDVLALQQPQQRVATKDDYIYIPLKGPSTRDTNNSNNINNNNRQNNSTSPVVSNNQPVAHKNGLTNHQNRFFHQEEMTPHQPQVLRNKPPLPTNNNNLIVSGRSPAGASAPPRVVGACVKRDGGVATPRDDSDDSQPHHHHQQQQQQQRRPHQSTSSTNNTPSNTNTTSSSSGSGGRRRRTTIDSGVLLQDTTPSPPPAPWCRQQQGGGRSQQQQQFMDPEHSSTTTATNEEDAHRQPTATPPAPHRMGLIETDLDTEVTVITSRTTTCSPFIINNRPPPGPGGALHQLHHHQGISNVKTTRSLLNLGGGGCDETPHRLCGGHSSQGGVNCSSSGGGGGGSRCTPPPADIISRRGTKTLGPGINDSGSGGGRSAGGRPHKSMEFLLDKQNLKVVEPPENELQKGERVMSEHQLRVQRSLQKLNVPDWYKQNHVPREGFLLLRKPSSSFSTNRETRWAGTCSTTTNKTTSLSSLGSNTTNASCTTNYAQQQLQSSSPVALSPTAQQHQPFVRWSTSKLNSTASSPCASTRSSFNARQPNGSISPSSVRSSFSYRQPYLGWRSQEKLARPRTPAERLANSLLGSGSQNSHQSQPQPQVEESPDFQSSIKEMTSAIVHYVHGLKPDSVLDEQSQSRSKSSSPRGSSQRLCWLESSFVGTKPLDSPQTPLGLAESHSQSSNVTTANTPAPPSSLRLELQTHNEVSLLNSSTGPRPSPGSTTLEDVLDSLLGLPSSDRAPSPSLQAMASANTSPSRLEGGQDLSSFAQTTTEQPHRRHSEGSEPPNPGGNNSSRRVSFQSSPVLQCRYSRCGRVVSASSSEGLSFKNCHNCSYTYCSRACRRAHWEKHRKTCLFSRIGTLCRQVIAAVKEQKDTLLHLSTIARRGYLSHGTGAVKCFFPCPESAERFLSDGLDSLGELTYVRWLDLLPSEMGAQLYAELVHMCKTYNPDNKLVLYVSVCVVSETPATGAVKWERQLVSRCAKMRLSKDISVPDRDQPHQKDNPPETLVLTCKPIEQSDIMEANKLKELCVNNVQKLLRQRGVSLKRQHPVIFRQLSAYGDGSCEKFTPITVYPKDSATGRSFMCIIMLEADQDTLRQVELAGVRVRTVDVLQCDDLSS